MFQDASVQDLPQLTDAQKLILKRGKIATISDALLTPSDEIAKRCKVSLIEIKGILEPLLYNKLSAIRTLEEAVDEEVAITTGDEQLDKALGGGIQTGMLWEVAGESAAGKTQFALQLALHVQLSPEQGGASGSACYITTSSKLSTPRLTEIKAARSILSSASLDDIHTLSTPTIPTLVQVLSVTLPSFMKSIVDRKPVKLLVIDALAELFHSSDKTSTKTLVERSKRIAEISALLHSLASQWNMAILILNEVVDVFQDGSLEAAEQPLDYRRQSRLFARADSVPGQSSKEAALGLVWANQVNTRIMFSRTGRRRYLDLSDDEYKSKRLKGAGPVNNTLLEDSTQPTLIRRLSVIFSSVCQPCSLDYIVTTAGISTLPSDESLGKLPPPPPKAVAMALHTESSRSIPLSTQLAPLDVGAVEDSDPTLGEPDEWDEFWASDPIPDEVFDLPDPMPPPLPPTQFVQSSQAEEVELC